MAEDHGKKARIGGVNSGSEPKARLWGTCMQRHCNSGYLQLSRLHIPKSLAAFSMLGPALDAGMWR